MLIENTKRLIDGSIQADFDGITMVVPDDMSNRHRAEMDRQGIPIAPIPSPTFEDIRAAKLAALAAKRWQIETGGITVGGSLIATDRDSQGLIGNAYVGAIRHPTRIIKFKGVNGWVTLAAETMIAIGDAVFFHVQESFAREEALAAEIGAATDQAALNAIDINTNWPA